MKYEEIKSIFGLLSEKYLENDYKTNEILSIRKNDLKAENILSEISRKETRDLPKDLSSIEKLNLVIGNTLANGNSKKRKVLFDVLLKYGYNTSNELLKMLSYADRYFESEISDSEFKDYFFKLVSALKVKEIKQNELNLTTLNGSFFVKKLDYECNLPRLNKITRRNNGNVIASEVLSDNENLYGAFYNIPLELFGNIGYCVLIDFNKGLVYDFANNAIVSLKIWNSYYGEPSLLISGKDYQVYRHCAIEDYNIHLDLPMLECIRKRIKQ